MLDLRLKFHNFHFSGSLDKHREFGALRSCSPMDSKNGTDSLYCSYFSIDPRR